MIAGYRAKATASTPPSAKAERRFIARRGLASSAAEWVGLHMSLQSEVSFVPAAPPAGTVASRSPAVQLEQAVGDVLKQSSAASPGAGSATWGMTADYYAALGFHASAREALLKQVRPGARRTTSPVLLSSVGKNIVLVDTGQFSKGSLFAV